MQSEKPCTKCAEVKPLAEFYWTSRRNGERARHSVCQTCRRAQFRAWARTEGGKKVKRNGILRREYGISEAEYEAMLAEQHGRCAICREPETKVHRDGSMCRLAVDHNHRTGRARALLCSACNVGLGSFGEDADRLRAAADYLIRRSME